MHYSDADQISPGGSISAVHMMSSLISGWRATNWNSYATNLFHLEPKVEQV